MSEHDEQVALFRYLQYLRREELDYIFAIPNGGFYNNIRIAQKMKAEGVKSGVWDIFVPIPKDNYHGLFVEMKVKPNRLTPNQKEFGRFFTDQGYQTKVAYDWKEGAKIILEYLGYEINGL